MPFHATAPARHSSLGTGLEIAKDRLEFLAILRQAGVSRVVDQPLSIGRDVEFLEALQAAQEAFGRAIEWLHPQLVFGLLAVDHDRVVAIVLTATACRSFRSTQRRLPDEHNGAAIRPPPEYLHPLRRLGQPACFPSRRRKQEHLALVVSVLAPVVLFLFMRLWTKADETELSSVGREDRMLGILEREGELSLARLVVLRALQRAWRQR